MKPPAKTKTNRGIANANDARASSSPDQRAGLETRRAALEILVAVAERGAFADAMLGARIPGFAPADRRLVTRLVLGTLAWQARLDYEIERLAGRKLRSIDPAVLALLRLGLFQLRFLDRVPAHAAVDTAVTLAKERRETRAASGMVNAVMRRATRETIPMPPRERDLTAHLAIAYSHPRWLVERFIEWFGEADAEHLMTADNEAAPNVIRLNLGRASRAEILERLAADGFEVDAGGRALETIILKSAARFESESYRAGLFHAQSEASQLVARMLAPQPGATVVDCAAAPGGKSTHLAEMVGEGGRVIALDVNFGGLKQARSLAHRLGHRHIDFVRADLAVAAPPLRPASFDYVLLDAPCTGLGTLREHPEIRWRVTPADTARMAALQMRMLANAASMVRAGGAIVYSVCSLAPEEGGGVIAAFLGAHRAFHVDSEPLREPPNREAFAGLLDEDGIMRTRPDRGGLDGFFAVRLQRR
ncbi:MAG TPA: 16S rRNA (cytosine(967)-C(5))-methyltransferase RsmB [Candidatus Binataceae bacterium]